jgi:hypothetical protein
MSAVFEPPGLDRGNLVERPGLAPAANSRLRMLALSLPAIVALVIWGVSLLHVDVYNLGDYGLPPALPITWYAALLLSVLGAVTAITAQRTSGLIMVGYVLVVAVILFGTVPALSPQPHYAWVYKHIGVVRYLEITGKANPSIDIYNRWPGFFALAAVFSRLAGSPNPETYAGWTEFFFLLLDAVLVMAAVKVITREIRIATGAALFFVVTNWVGQTYFSPQGFAFVLCLALILIILRQMRTGGINYSHRLTRWIERLARAPQLPLQTDDARRWPRWAAITIVLGLDAVIVASHQLTPYMLLASVALLMLTGVIRPWWMLVGMAIMTFAYLGANFQFIQHNYGVFTSIDPFNNVKISTYTETPSTGKLFNTHTELLLTFTLWLGSLWAVVRLGRQGLLVRSLPFVVLAAAPFVIIFGQNYGGEGILRIILFSSPWCAALISWALATVSRRPLKWLLMAIAATVFTGLFVPSFLGGEELNIISAAEVRASERFYYHARPGSVLLLSAPGFPYRYGGTYPEFRGPEGDANPNLLTTLSLQNRQLGAADIPRVIERIKEYARYGYISFTKDQTAFAEVMGVTPHGALTHLEEAIARSPRFRLWYSNKDVQIYELLGPRHRTRDSRRATRASRDPSPQMVKPAAPAGRYVFAWHSPRIKTRERSGHVGIATKYGSPLRNPKTSR